MNQAWYDTIVANVSCADTLDTLQCLREVPFESLNAAVNVTSTGTYGFVPSIDGDFLRNWGSLQLSKGQFVKVPIIMGTNTDEGTFFSPNGINNDQQLYDFLTGNVTLIPFPYSATADYLLAGAAGYNLTSSMADKIQSLYPNVPRDGIPAYLGNETVQSKGLEWRRVSTYAGDFLMHASRRKQCKAWAAFGVTAYCYRFNVHSSQAPYIMGATHFEEVAFVFNNLEGVGYHYGKPFTGTPPSYSQLSYLMSSMWASFIHESNPNTGGTAPKWPVYKRREAEDFVFDANITSYIENDTWRGEAIDFINSLSTYLQR
jgi:triacylglycerol lipase